MKILITGAGGNLGRSLVPALHQDGHTTRLFDSRPLQTSDEFFQGDVRNREDLERAVDGVDAIVHAAALHGIHTKTWAPSDFWDINVSGTFNIYEAVRQAGIPRVVLCSTMGVYGESMRAPDGAWGMVTEESPMLPGDVYGLTKLLCEEQARYHARVSGITTVALRLGMFVPGTFEHYGFRLLFGGVDDRDVAQAVKLALAYEPEARFDAFNIFADVPFSAGDAPSLHDNPLSVIERYWPGTTALLAEKGIDATEHIWGHLIWPPDRARRVLGYHPRYTFTEFLDALRRDDPGHYPFAELPHWGV